MSFGADFVETFVTECHRILPLADDLTILTFRWERQLLKDQDTKTGSCGIFSLAASAEQGD